MEHRHLEHRDIEHCYAEGIGPRAVESAEPSALAEGIRPEGMRRRDFLSLAAAAGAAPIVGPHAVTQNLSSPIAPRPAREPAREPARGLLHPQRNQFRDLLDTSGLWQFQLDPGEQGEAQGWFRALPAPRPIAVPCSWNGLFDDARDYLGLAWYRTELWVPQDWRERRVFLRVGSATYAATVWVNGTRVTQHQGGHLPFLADVSGQLAWDRPNVIAIAIENKQLPERVPPGPTMGGGGVAGVVAGFPPTTYDFFPFAGLDRPVLLYTVPAAAHIDDITVVTTLDGRDGVVQIQVLTGDAYAGTGAVRLNGGETALRFRDESEILPGQPRYRQDGNLGILMCSPYHARPNEL